MDVPMQDFVTHTHTAAPPLPPPPPSTLAAQIVNSLQRPPDQLGHSSTLQDLLRSFLIAGREAFGDSGLDVKCQLADLLLKACLRLFRASNPFEPKFSGTGQALEALEVVEATIRHSPGLLLHSYDAYHATRGGRAAPFLFTLVPQLIMLLGDDQNTAVSATIHHIFKSCRRSELRGGFLKRSYLSTSIYLEGCIQDLLKHLLSVQENPGLSGSSRIPSRGTVDSTCLVENGQAFKFEQITPGSFARTATIITRLLNIHLDEQLMTRRPRSMQDKAMQHTARLVRHICLARSVPLLPSANTHTYVGLLSLLQSLLKIFSDNQRSQQNFELAISSLCCLVEHLLRFNLSLLGDVLERELCVCLHECLSLDRTSVYNHSILIRHFSQRLQKLVVRPRDWSNSGVDLQISVMLTCSSILGLKSEPVNFFLQRFRDETLREKFSVTCAEPRWSKSGAPDEDRHPSKRLKIDRHSMSLDLGIDNVISRELTNMGVQVVDNETFRTGPDAWMSFFPGQEANQTRVIELMHQSCCSFKQNSTLKCGICTCRGQRAHLVGDKEQQCLDNVFVLLTNLVTVHPGKSNAMVMGKASRVQALHCLSTLLAHTGNSQHLDLSSTQIGKWCVRCLNSSNKDVRTAAGKVMLQYTRPQQTKATCRRNRHHVLDALRHVASSGNTFRNETCIWVLGQIADGKPGEDEMNIILLRLTEYLGQSHPVVNALAFSELLRMCGHSSYRAQKLFEPYWKFLATSAVKDAVRKPSMLQRLADLLEISVDEFLVSTRLYTIPYLVVTKRKDVIERISNAMTSQSGSFIAIREACLNPEQLPSLLALLLMRAPSDPEAFIFSTISSVFENFTMTNVSDLVKPDPVKIAFELFKAAGDGEEKNMEKAQAAIVFLADHYYQRQGSSGRKSSRKLDNVGLFFESHSLAILKLLSDVVTEAHSIQVLPERRRCLAGIKHMIAISGDHAAGSLPQITSCLRAAMSTADLCEEGFEAWLVLMRSMTDLSSHIVPTFAFIKHHWSDLSPSNQQKTHELLIWLFKENQSVMTELVSLLPSLTGIPLLAKFEADISECKKSLDSQRSFLVFSKRLESEDPLIVSKALEELEAYLITQQDYIQTSSLTEQPDPIISSVFQSLLDACVRFSSFDRGIALTCSKCLGMVGCLDPTRIELHRRTREIIVISNFTIRDETIDFIVFFLEEVLVKTFLASLNPRSQNFLGFAMQNLLEICNFRTNHFARSLEENESNERWTAMSESTRNVLTPFLSSRYTLLEGSTPADTVYPIFNPNKLHDDWLREFVYDLLRKSDGENANLVFGICKRIIRNQDLSIAAFLLPYVALNIMIGASLDRKHDIGKEFMSVLIQPMEGEPQANRDNTILCSQDIFRTLDYFSRWVHQKRQTMARMRLSANEVEKGKWAVQTIEGLSSTIPAEIMSKRAVECKNFSRGLFYWERYIRQWRLDNQDLLDKEPQSADFLYKGLQDIYVQIDEPDGIEGVTMYLQLLDVDQQVLEHKKAGKWTSVQDWNEMRLADEPDNGSYQMELLTSLRESGQYGALLNQVSAFNTADDPTSMTKSFVVEACWSASRWQTLAGQFSMATTDVVAGFTNSVGAAFAALYEKRYDDFSLLLDNLRVNIARGLSKSSVLNLQSCRESLLQLHALVEIEAICDVHHSRNEPSSNLKARLDQRLNILGAFPTDKQYLLSLRRAAMQLSKHHFTEEDISSLWLTSARLYRKQNLVRQAFKAILHASQLDDKAATMERARLLWKEGKHRKAIQSLEGAIAAHTFQDQTAAISFDGDQSHTHVGTQKPQNLMTAKAQLLRAKWLDRAGQTQSEAIIRQYQEACASYARWEKGQYSLGRHYNKLLESERLKPASKQAQPVLTGEYAKHVIENYLRSMAWGARYIHQTLPRVLTLWCDLGAIIDQPLDAKYGTDESFRNHVHKYRKSFFEHTVNQVKKYIDRLPAFVFYTALNQVCARICHTNPRIYTGLADIVTKVCVAHPQQALWTLLAMVRSAARDRMQRGQACIAKIQEHAKRSKNEGGAAEIRILVSQGTKVTEQLLEVCNADLRKFPKRQSKVSIRDMGFNQKQASPCKLVIPLEVTLTATLPPAADTVNMRQHKAFSKDPITIQSFQDEVLLLSSLVRPRKVDIRGSDGQIYSLLCKPKDDLRLDQRLLEFNATIKRLLKKDAASTKRRLYVKTYAVTPLNEECGLIEWVEGLRTHRDVMLKIYSNKGITPDYRVIGNLLEEAITDDLTKFTMGVQKMFPLVFHEWFVESFPDPEAWFVARTRYTRSCGVMSMVGHVLGLGDRHSENILVEEGNGGIMHVDFNCLFDKGLTFEKPEKVPFRLTANMVDAFGAYGYEGPYRRACELTMAILRQNEDVLMTILEQFLHDPTIELMGGRKKKPNADVPNTPEGVLESVRNKVRGLLPKEAVPLSVEGQVDHLIKQARDPFRLASMYIGWCAFL